MKNIQKRSNMQQFTRFTVVIVCLFLFARPTAAQMFSVDDQSDRATRPTLNSLMIGAAPTNFSFRGGNQAGVLRLDYEDIMFRAALETPTLNIHMAYGVNLGDSDDITAFNLGASVGNRVPLNRNPRTQAYLPVRLMTDWRTVRNTRTGTSNDEFQQSSVMAGTGFGTMIRTTSKSYIDLSANGNYGYAVRSFGADGGQTFLLEGKARYIVNNITNALGLSVGYDYSFQEYYIGGNQFDYRLSGHSFIVGIRF
jgi:hypothetical protein